MKEKINQFIDSKRDEIIAMSDYIFDNPELGLKEYKSSKVLKDYLRENQFTVEENVAGLETAFRATFKIGEGGPKIGLLCEYDALPNLGHACGHHMQGPAIASCAVALSKYITEESCEIIVYGTPAEESESGKILMLKKECFKELDVALMMHGSPTTCTDNKSLAATTFNIKFHGKSSHAALSPEKGRSALDGVLLLFQGIEFLREHVREDVKMHYTIINAGGPANVVPKEAEAQVYLRSYNRLYLDSVIERFKKIVQGASLMTETDYEIIIGKSLDNKIPVSSLNELIMKNAEELKAPRITPPREKTGSTDFGNVMFVVPGSCLRMAFVPEGSSSHSEIYLEYGKSKEAHDAIILSSKILAATTIDIINDKIILSNIKDEFEKNKYQLAL